MLKILNSICKRPIIPSVTNQVRNMGTAVTSVSAKLRKKRKRIKRRFSLSLFVAFRVLVFRGDLHRIYSLVKRNEIFLLYQAIR